MLTAHNCSIKPHHKKKSKLKPVEKYNTAHVKGTFVFMYHGRVSWTRRPRHRFNEADLNEPDWVPSPRLLHNQSWSIEDCTRQIHLRQWRHLTMFSCCWSAPRTTRKNTACLVTYLIATGHHLCIRFPLLVFRAQMRLISWPTLIRGHTSEHSRVSHKACWEKWNAINQSGLLFNVLNSGNKWKCWLGQWCRDEVCLMNSEQKIKSSEALQTCLVKKFPKLIRSHEVAVCIEISFFFFLH